MVVLIFATAIIFIGLAIVSYVERSPEGYEDERGWHKGKDE